jgi:hypothetical protein
MHVAVAKQGYEEKMSLDAAYEMTNSTTKVVYFCRSKLVARRANSNTLYHTFYIYIRLCRKKRNAEV